MWNLLKAEIAYNLPIFGILLAVSLIGFVALLLWPPLSGETPANSNLGTFFLAFMFFHFLTALLSTPWSKEKRPRLLVLLPLKVRRINLAHFFLFLVYWGFIVALFMSYVVISRSFYLSTETVISLGTISGMAFSAYSGIVFLNVFSESVWRKTLEAIWILILGFLAMAGIVHIFQLKPDAHIADSLLSWMFLTKTASGGWLLCGLGSAVAARLWISPRSFR